jgi:hypothetical protein
LPVGRKEQTRFQDRHKHMAQSCLTVKTLREIWLTKGLVEHRLDARVEGRPKASSSVEL